MAYFVSYYKLNGLRGAYVEALLCAVFVPAHLLDITHITPLDLVTS